MATLCTNFVFPATTWKGYLREYSNQVQHVLDLIPEDKLDEVFRALSLAVRQGRTVFVAGNGGSAAIAEHLCCDWTKGTQSPDQAPLRTHSLASNVPMLTALANDCGFDSVFSRQLEMSGKPGDVLLLISSSGSSANIVAAIEMARKMGILTIGLTGFSGGILAKKADVCLHVPFDNYGIVEDCHQILMHTFAQLFLKLRESGTASEL